MANSRTIRLVDRGVWVEKNSPGVLSRVNSYLDADNPLEALLICFPAF